LRVGQLVTSCPSVRYICPKSGRTHLADWIVL